MRRAPPGGPTAGRCLLAVPPLEDAIPDGGALTRRRRGALEQHPGVRRLEALRRGPGRHRVQRVPHVRREHRAPQRHGDHGHHQLRGHQRQPGPGEHLLRAAGGERHRAGGQRGLHPPRQRAAEAVPRGPPAGPSRRDHSLGESYTYCPGDVSVGDLDGDGEYESSSSGIPRTPRTTPSPASPATCSSTPYRLNGTRLWRIDLGRNIRAGAHYTQFQVYDYDGDGRGRGGDEDGRRHRSTAPAR